MITTAVAASDVYTVPFIRFDLFDGQACVKTFPAVGVVVGGGMGCTGTQVAVWGAGGVLGAKGETVVALSESNLFLPGSGEDLGATHVGDGHGQSGEEGAIGVVDAEGDGACGDVPVTLVRVHSPVGLLDEVGVGKGWVVIVDHVRNEGRGEEAIVGNRVGVLARDLGEADLRPRGGLGERDAQPVLGKEFDDGLGGVLDACLLGG